DISEFECAKLIDGSCHAHHGCGGGQCGKLKCDSKVPDYDWFDCNFDMPDPNGDGCEIDLMTDPNHCGTCGNKCAPDQQCLYGLCVCPAGQRLCTGSEGMYCTDLSQDPQNCGVCLNACPGPVAQNNFGIVQNIGHGSPT